MKSGSVIAAAVLLSSAAAMGQTATFDAYPEGAGGEEFVEAGIWFFEYDNRSEPPPSMMMADRADGTLAGQPGFSAPNALAFGGWVPGSGVSFGQFGSLHIEPVSGRADTASIHVYDFGNLHNNRTLTLEAFLGGQLVASDTVTLSTGSFVRHNLLSVGGAEFDELLLSAGPGGDDVVYILIDTVTVRLETLTLDPPSPGTAGVNNILSAHGATPGARVHFIYGLRSGSTNVPGCPGVTVGMNAPIIAGSQVADVFGDTDLTRFVPPAASGRRVLLQAVEQSSCTVSNLVDFTFN